MYKMFSRLNPSGFDIHHLKKKQTLQLRKCMQPLLMHQQVSTYVAFLSYFGPDLPTMLKLTFVLMLTPNFLVWAAKFDII